ncbi:hypothetical protein TBLA_0E01010 [Henningerozyma blattae CBS 6284]|uniref:NAD-dependent epimerase/dehydratase domain-containing protein n=1 Tax=Henningerozyma blattae (strain ATCC 34711 / CBS 6284 / DSM 70876 / NBRC 10599 / NRRL Y-10934 / UCD 77-7) TaxID=1071380 RepID=I2H459_HENB6|nr:hypothetical protein TBLA_0E01010 [Tetrapisispora blattae CBS 6284]CCH61161.1 hypothetical protein TBLA_0E01010 [Tetrapisispora blattae CBS 6284]
MSKIVVFGGNGLLGKRICQESVNRGLKVYSITRSGKTPTFNSPAKPNEWVDKVNWLKGDLFDPHSYKSVLMGADHVVHSVGILFEGAGYKKLANAPITSLPGVIWDEVCKGPEQPNPFETEPLTYHNVNTRAATLLCDTVSEVAKHTKSTISFSYISAHNGSPLIPQGYIDSKRAAEHHILHHSDPEYVRPLILRPGFMYDQEEGLLDNPRYAISNVVGLGNCFGMIPAPLTTQQVAAQLVSRLGDPQACGVVSADELAKPVLV